MFANEAIFQTTVHIVPSVIDVWPQIEAPLMALTVVRLIVVLIPVGVRHWNPIDVCLAVILSSVGFRLPFIVGYVLVVAHSSRPQIDAERVSVAPSKRGVCNQANK